jgi:hypothetical protein
MNCGGFETGLALEAHLQDGRVQLLGQLYPGKSDWPATIEHNIVKIKSEY